MLVQAQLFPVQGANAGAFRILIQRPDATGVFSGDFGNSTDNSTEGLASLQRSFAGEYVPLEVFDVNAGNGTDEEGGTGSLTPTQLCEYLKEQNPGTAGLPLHDTCPSPDCLPLTTLTRKARDLGPGSSP